jgi:protease-4
MNSLTSSTMPAPQRANMQGLVDSLTGQLIDAVAAGRHLNRADAQKLVAGGPYSAQAAKAAALVDQLGYWDQAEQAALAAAGADAKTVGLSDYIARLPDPAGSAPKIAVVYASGEIDLGRSRGAFGQSNLGARTVAEALHEAVDDKKFAGIIFRIDSPGGSYVAADTIWREVERARQKQKPLVVSMGALAASGGYFAAAPADVIVAEPGTLTGSIGVFAGKFVIKDLLTKLGINIEDLAGTPNALTDSMTKSYTPEQWALLEHELDRTYDDFMTKVAAGRHMSKEAVHAVAKGQVWTGVDAKARGLVDELGGFATATAAVKRLAKIAPDAEVALEQYPAPSSNFASALSNLTSASQSRSLAGLLMQRLSQLASPLLAALGGWGPEAGSPTLRAPLP